jgi:hypothetical protein
VIANADGVEMKKMKDAGVKMIVGMGGVLLAGNLVRMNGATGAAIQVKAAIMTRTSATGAAPATVEAETTIMAGRAVLMKRMVTVLTGAATVMIMEHPTAVMVARAAVMMRNGIDVAIAVNKAIIGVIQVIGAVIIIEKEIMTAHQPGIVSFGQTLDLIPDAGRRDTNALMSGLKKISMSV